MFGWIQDVAAAGAAAEAAGQVPSELQRGMQEAWGEVHGFFYPGPEQLAQETAFHGKGYWEGFGRRSIDCLLSQIFSNAMFFFWRALGLMLVGAGLMRLGVLTATRSYRFYVTMIVAGYGLGLPLSAMSAWSMVATDFDLVQLFKIGLQLDYAGGVLVALGHVALVMIVCKAGVLRLLTTALGAAGRMALTNYLTQSLICVFLFEGWGLGWFMECSRTQLVGVVVSVWILQLALSPVWLARFRFGPAEWLWRSLTYWKLQPMM
jgi:uncharacterized protein